jgi:pimeloyl-ACP methyl ester carboxylesterase
MTLVPRLLAALLLALAPLAHAADDWLTLPDAVHERVAEPVFGGEVWVYQAGRRHAQAVVLVHGLGERGSQDWAQLIPALARRYHVLAFDLPGFGRSSRGNELYSPANYTALIRHLTQRYLDRPFKLVGHSMGGAISLHYAASHPEDVSQLVLVDAAGILHRAIYAQFLSGLGIELLPAFYPGQDGLLGDLAGRLLRRAEGLPLDTELVLQIPQARAAVLAGEPTRIAALALVEENFSSLIPRVRAPTLIVWGELDPIAPLRTGKLLAANIAGARLQVLGDLKHMPMLEDPVRFNAVLLQELGRSPEELARLGKSAAYALAAAPAAGERVGRCENARDRVFRGDYARIEIRGCRGVKLIGVRARELLIERSVVEIENSHIITEGVALRAVGSELQITGGSLRGSVALALTGSRADVAGVQLIGGTAAVTAGGRGSSDFMSSVSRVQSAGRAWYRHEVRRLPPGSEL